MNARVIERPVGQRPGVLAHRERRHQQIIWSANNQQLSTSLRGAQPSSDAWSVYLGSLKMAFRRAHPPPSTGAHALYVLH